jgi:hypothetical protein
VRAAWSGRSPTLAQRSTGPALYGYRSERRDRARGEVPIAALRSAVSLDLVAGELPRIAPLRRWLPRLWSDAILRGRTAKPSGVRERVDAMFGAGGRSPGPPAATSPDSYDPRTNCPFS